MLIFMYNKPYNLRLLGGAFEAPLIKLLRDNFMPSNAVLRFSFLGIAFSNDLSQYSPHFMVYKIDIISWRCFLVGVAVLFFTQLITKVIKVK